LEQTTPCALTREDLEEIIHSIPDTIIVYDREGHDLIHSDIVTENRKKRDAATGALRAQIEQSEREITYALKNVLATGKPQSKIETANNEVFYVLASRLEVDGVPYVLELVNQIRSDDMAGPADTGSVLSQLLIRNRQVYMDSVTKVYNRRYYEEVVRNNLGPAGIALMDIDDFKICNDTYGHHAGDLALETVAKAIRSCIRETDLLIRYGGDEFLLVLPGIPADFFKTKLEQIRDAAQKAVVPGYPHFRLSLSIGGAMQTLADPMENVVRRADLLMYQAKNHKDAVAVDTQDSRLTDQKDILGEKPVILLVDDSLMNRMMLASILGEDYRILEAENGKQCLDLLREKAGQISLVLLDINMPVMDGFEVLRTMNTNHTIEDVPVIMISSDDSEEVIRKAYELGASDYVNRPFDAKIVYRRVVNTIKLYAKQRRLVQMVSDQIRAREKNTDVLVGVLSQIVEFRNGESGSHVRHIRVITETLLHRLMELTNRYDLTPEQQDNIPLASALHDIGKIGIDEAILNKPGRLTPEEFAVIKTHSMLGAEMLQKTESFADQPLLQTACEIARWHHERWDGKGYPDGLKGDDIPISAQLVSMADVYDALTSERCYKKAFPHETAVQMITDGECGAFNPLLIQCLLDVQGELKQEILQW